VGNPGTRYEERTIQAFAGLSTMEIKESLGIKDDSKKTPFGPKLPINEEKIVKYR